MKIKQYIEDKIFITGISGTGKTKIAKYISDNAHPTNPHKYLSLDYDFDYRYNNESQYVQDYLKNLPKRFVMDGIPYQAQGLSMNFDSFKKYNLEHKIKILCLVPTDFNEWKQRILAKQQAIGYASINFFIFYYHILPQLTNLNIDYYDTCNNKYISIETLYKEITWIAPLSPFI